MDYTDLGHKLRVERTKLNYKQDYIAEKIGVCQRYVSKIEHGRAKPEFAKVFEIASILGLSLDSLVDNENIQKTRTILPIQLLFAFSFYHPKKKILC